MPADPRTNGSRKRKYDRTHAGNVNALFRASPSLVAAADELAEREGVSRSEVMRQALIEMVERNGIELRAS